MCRATMMTRVFTGHADYLGDNCRVGNLNVLVVIFDVVELALSCDMAELMADVLEDVIILGVLCVIHDDVYECSQSCFDFISSHNDSFPPCGVPTYGLGWTENSVS